MKKLLCDICNGALEMNANGQGAVCATCGMTYSTARLKEMLNVGAPAQQDAEEIVYDITDFEVVDACDDGKQFWLIVENLFQIKGRGMAVTGIVQDASVHLHDLVTIIRADGSHLTTKVLGIEHYDTLFDRADPGEGVGLLLENTQPNQVSIGDVIAISGEAKQSISDYYTVVRCKNCNTPFQIATQCNRPLPNCPNCNTPL